MTSKEIINILYKEDGSLNASTNKESFFIKNHPNIHQMIVNKVLVDVKFIEKVYIYVNDLSIPPCCECGITLKLVSFTKGYNTFCSKSCSNKSKTTKNKIGDTKEERYGDRNFVNVSKGKDTKLKLYGDINYNNRKKAIETSIAKYGVEHTSKMASTIEKMKNTSLELYGVDYHITAKDIRDKSKITLENNFGVSSPFESSEIRNKAKKTIIEKYGVDNVNKLDSTISKRKTTNKKKYGVEHGVQSDVVKNKIRLYYEETFGTSYPQQVENIKNKTKATIDNSYINKYKDIFDIEINGDVAIIKNHCSTHSTFTIDKHNLYQRYFKYKIPICTECYPIEINSSIKELMIGEILDKHNIQYERNNRKVLNGKELDYYLPGFNLAIEVNGVYYHSDLFKNKEYHIDKTESCEAKGIKLLQIWDVDMINKYNIIESIILYHIKNDIRTIYARKCVIKDISYNESKEFLNQNHLQGSCVSKHRLGLFLNNELVAVMTFGGLRRNLNQHAKSGSYELLRFCNKLKTTVIGGFSKLLKHFEKESEDLKELISYANRDISSGSVYQMNGLTFVSKTKPNYFWSKNNKIYNRYTLRKDVLVKKGYDISKTEEIILKENGYYKIWNSGNLKFIKQY
jgi:hypothetical protein